MDIDQLLLCALPKLVQEGSIQQFSFFADGEIHTGMSFDRKFYVLHRSFRQHKRTHAFALASALVHQGATAIITSSSQDLFYRVWLDLHYASYLRSTALEDGISDDINCIVEETSYQVAA